MSQLDVFEVHRFENRAESQMILDANRDHFSRQCRVIFDLLFSGKSINSHTAVKEYGIVDLRRRLCDLKSNGVRLSWTLSENGRTKEWFFSKEDKEVNKRFA